MNRLGRMLLPCDVCGRDRDESLSTQVGGRKRAVCASCKEALRKLDNELLVKIRGVPDE